MLCQPTAGGGGKRDGPQWQPGKDKQWDILNRMRTFPGGKKILPPNRTAAKISHCRRRQGPLWLPWAEKRVLAWLGHMPGTGDRQTGKGNRERNRKSLQQQGTHFQLLDPGREAPWGDGIWKQLFGLLSFGVGTVSMSEVEIKSRDLIPASQKFSMIHDSSGPWVITCRGSGKWVGTSCSPTSLHGYKGPRRDLCLRSSWLPSTGTFDWSWVMRNHGQEVNSQSWETWQEVEKEPHVTADFTSVGYRIPATLSW